MTICPTCHDSVEWCSTYRNERKVDIQRHFDNPHNWPESDNTVIEDSCAECGQTEDVVIYYGEDADYHLCPEHQW